LKKLKADNFMRTAVSFGDTPPQLLHEDKFDVMSFLIYLTDGGANTVFPFPGVTITPKKGAVAMWLNVDKDGNGLQSAFHAVQAHPSHSGERMIAKVSFPRKSNILAEAATSM
jgi:hypothetical protein